MARHLKPRVAIEQTQDIGWIERTLSLEDVMELAWPWLGITAAASLLPHILLNGFPWPTSVGLFFARLFLFVVAYVLGVVVHELFHVVGMLVFGRVAPRSVTFGHRLREGVVYVHTSQPMSARAYRGVLVLPGIVTGIVPVILGIAVGSFWITFYGWVMVVSAVGDVAILRLMRDLPAHIFVQDHPSEIGLRIRTD